MGRRFALAGVPLWAIGVVLATTAVAWVGAGLLARRQLAETLPRPALDGFSAPVRDAIVAADQAARDAPSAASVGALGRAYHGAQRPTDALAAYALAARLDRADPRWTYLASLLLEERGDADGASARFQQVVAVTPSHGLAWFHLGELAFKRGALDEAQAAYARARDAPVEPPFLPPGVTSRALLPLSTYARLGLARVALDRGQRDEAGRELEAILAAYPAFSAAQALRRELDRGRSTPSPAARVAFEAPYVPPADPHLDAVVAASVDADLLLKHAGLATRAGDAAWREFLLQRALAAHPADLNVLMEMASMRQAQGRPAEALEYLRQHEALAPGDHHTLVEQGRSLMDLNRLADAEAVLRRAVVVRDAAAEYNLASVLDRLDRWDEARPRYERALAIDPFHTRSMNNLGAGLDRRGQTAQAIALFERAIAIAPASGEFYVNYGSALMRQGRFDDAVRAITEAVALTPRDANAHNNLGIARARKGDLTGARDAFARALEIDPRHQNARDNLAQVTQALGAR